MSFLSRSQFHSPGCTFFVDEFILLLSEPVEAININAILSRELCCVKGVSIGHCVCCTSANCFWCPWFMDWNCRCSDPALSGCCLFILSYWQTPFPEERQYLPSTAVKLKPQWGEGRCFVSSEKWGIFLRKDVPVSDWLSSSLPVRLFALSLGNRRSFPLKDYVGYFQECRKVNLVPLTTVIFTLLCNTGAQWKCEELLFTFKWNMVSINLGRWLITPKLN